MNKTGDSVKEMLNIYLKDGWPKSKDGWEKTVSLTMPRSPDLSVDMKSKYFDVTHTLVMKMKLKANRGGRLFKRTEEYSIQ
ncbi:hypothetical protein BGZ58_011002, partial [Dissophora ornata]